MKFFRFFLILCICVGLKANDVKVFTLTNKQAQKQENTQKNIDKANQTSKTDWTSNISTFKVDYEKPLFSNKLQPQNTFDSTPKKRMGDNVKIPTNNHPKNVYEYEQTAFENKKTYKTLVYDNGDTAVYLEHNVKQDKNDNEYHTNNGFKNQSYNHSNSDNFNDDFKRHNERHSVGMGVQYNVSDNVTFEGHFDYTPDEDKYQSKDKHHK